MSSPSHFVSDARATAVRAHIHDLVAPRTDAVCAVDRVSFTIEKGERVAFIGPNGAGKSTTLKLLSGILYPDAGHAEVLGFVPWTQRKQLGFQLGTVFGQRSQLWYQLPARETFALLARVYEVEPALHRARLQLLTERFALGALLDRPVSQLSLGERMRAEITASLLSGLTVQRRPAGSPVHRAASRFHHLLAGAPDPRRSSALASGAAAGGSGLPQPRCRSLSTRHSALCIGQSFRAVGLSPTAT